MQADRIPTTAEENLWEALAADMPAINPSRLVDAIGMLIDERMRIERCAKCGVDHRECGRLISGSGKTNLCSKCWRDFTG